MKILSLSDTHGKHRQIPIEWMVPADIIIHGGDICNSGSLKEAIDFLEWFNNLNYKNKIYIAGNHDWVYEKEPYVIEHLMKNYPGITYLQDDFIVVDNVKIYGSPWQPVFYNWAFNLARGKDIQRKWDLIPLDCDIVCTHGPVHGILDFTPDGKFAGCEMLLNTIFKLNNTILHICGHIHQGHGFIYKHNKTFVNASILNEKYMVAYKPILIDFDKATKEVIIIE